MNEVSIQVASVASDPFALRVRRVGARVSVSRPVADLLAELIYGDRGRGDVIMLSATIDSRVAGVGCR